MSETVFRFLLSELTSLQVVCECGGVTDIPLQRLRNFTDFQCPVCRKEIQGTRKTPLSGLAAAILAAQDLDAASVRFTLPEKPAP